MSEGFEIQKITKDAAGSLKKNPLLAVGVVGAVAVLALLTGKRSEGGGVSYVSGYPQAPKQDLGFGDADMFALLDMQLALTDQMTQQTEKQSLMMDSFLTSMERIAQEKSQTHYQEPTRIPAAASKISVFGNAIDLGAAQSYLDPSKYDFIRTDTPYFNPKTITQGSIIVGGTQAAGGVSGSISGVTRIAGDDRKATEAAILKYAGG